MANAPESLNQNQEPVQASDSKPGKAGVLAFALELRRCRTLEQLFKLLWSDTAVKRGITVETLNNPELRAIVEKKLTDSVFALDDIIRMIPTNEDLSQINGDKLPARGQEILLQIGSSPSSKSAPAETKPPTPPSELSPTELPKEASPLSKAAEEGKKIYQAVAEKLATLKERIKSLPNSAEIITNNKTNLNTLDALTNAITHYKSELEKGIDPTKEDRLLKTIVEKSTQFNKLFSSINFNTPGKKPERIPHKPESKAENKTKKDAAEFTAALEQRKISLFEKIDALNDADRFKADNVAVLAKIESQLQFARGINDAVQRAARPADALTLFQKLEKNGESFTQIIDRVTASLEKPKQSKPQTSEPPTHAPTFAQVPADRSNKPGLARRASSTKIKKGFETPETGSAGKKRDRRTDDWKRNAYNQLLESYGLDSESTSHFGNEPVDQIHVPMGTIKDTLTPKQIAELQEVVDISSNKFIEALSKFSLDDIKEVLGDEMVGYLDTILKTYKENESSRKDFKTAITPDATAPTYSLKTTDRLKIVAAMYLRKNLNEKQFIDLMRRLGNL